MTLRLLALGLAALVGLTACSSSATSPDGGGEEQLTVFAAASLRDVLVELQERWETSNPGAGLVLAFDGSNVLATQIGEGAPADVFLSADSERPQRLAENGFAVGQPVVFAYNRIALVAPLDRDAVTSIDDLAEPGVSIVAAGSGVPITRYVDATLQQLATARKDGSTFLARVEANVVSREDNVRAALAKVELGEADAAFVYATDVPTADNVRSIPLPAELDVRADFTAVEVSDSATAARFVEWLTGAEAGAVLADAGFENVSP